MASLKSAFEIARTLPEMKTSDEIRNKVIELRAQILAAQDSALSAKMQCVELIDKNAELSRELRSLQDQLLDSE